MDGIGRRGFIKNILVASAGFALKGCRHSSASSYRRVIGANEDVRVGVVGLRSKGRALVNDFCNAKGARVVALCDVDETILAREMERMEEREQQAQPYTDVRRLLDDKSIDAIAIATPNHWHALATIWACQAGKDVYVEKPVSHNIWEGRQMVKATRRYKRVVQSGTHNRSSVGLKHAFEYIQDGNLGPISIVRGFCYKRRGSIGKVDGPQEPPASVDYNLWCGPAPLEPLARKSLHYDWHWVWATGNGDIGNQGIHEMDLCRWVLGVNGLLARVISIGGRFGYTDDGETPNTQIAFFDYEPAPILFEVRGLPVKKGTSGMDHYRGTRLGIVVDCENGYFVGGGGGGWVYDNDGKRVKQFKGSGGHVPNFVECVRNQQPEKLNAEVEEGHLSSALCHMANISYRLGKQTPPEQVRESIEFDKHALESFQRFQEHLAANEVDLEATPPILGPVLNMNSKAERFVGRDYSEKANKLLTRDYRNPFVVPEKV